MAGVDHGVSLRMWSGLLPQAGVSLGLAGIIGNEFKDTFGRDFQTTAIGIILLNQIIGPFGAKYMIRYSKEAGKGEDAHQHVFMALSDGLGENSVVRSANIETQTETRFFLEVDDVEDSLAFVDGEGNEVDEFGMELQTPALASITTNVRSSPSFLMRKAQSSAVSRWGKKNNLPYEMYPSTHDVESGRNPGAGTDAGAGVGHCDENSEAKTGGEKGDDVPPPPPGSPGLPRGRQLGRS
eukprot:CAMPEP_0170437354 /NCGR_PEP_ID=MMETSP0117_2-20130122/44635_1 /TAXON_ID=400756 /ORGANISM="Durinskia baltica, Strain CSIRO CS-38" /LENGTH=238 /DNA_ID=CAMNT_0010697461 /DNA_START=18 /DNA_END=730 /DNA_ORIENTATION=-